MERSISTNIKEVDMSLAKILKILEIVLSAGLISGVDTAKIKALIQIVELILEDDEK